MSLQEELQQIKREQAQALQAAQERRAQISKAILAQRSSLVARWSPLVKALLDETARATWGNDTYSIIEPDPTEPDATRSFTWTAVREQGTAKLNYQVSLRFTEASPDDPILCPNDPLVTPVDFQISGAQAFITAPSEQALKEGLISVFKAGPKDGGLDKYAEAILAKMPYKEGEYGKADWKIIAANAVTLLIGSCFLFSEENVLILPGILLIGLSSTAFIITEMGKKFRRLGSWQKALVIFAAIPGFIAGIYIVLAIIMLAGSAAASAKRAERISEIEEGVRRARR